MAEPENFTHRLLREIRSEMVGGFETMKTELAAVRDEVRENSKKLENVRQAAFGESILGRYTVAEVEERLEKLEKRLAMLESRI